MNCQLCKYRTRIIGHEAAQGEAQAGHHHHVVGVNAGHHHHHDGHSHGTRPFIARPDGVEEG
jgi:sirohydrochlorin cobaltochelatase